MRSLSEWGFLTLVVIVISLFPSFARAAEVRKSDRVEVRADEVVNDTLIAVGETIVIRGRVTGDAVALGQTVTVDGTIEGNLIVAADRVDIGGDVEGSVMSAGRELDIGARLGSQLYAAGQTIDLTKQLALSGDAILAGNEIDVAGSVGRDVYASGNRVGIDGMLARDLVLTGTDLRVDRGASVGRDVRAMVADEDDLVVDEGASILGRIEVEAGALAKTSRYKTFSFYAWRLMMIAAGLIVGVIVFSLAPNLFQAPEDRRRWLRTLGVGFLVLIAVPAASIVAAVLVIGLPLAAVAMGSYAIALYLGKLLVAAELGRRILRMHTMTRSELARSLLLGLLLVTVLVELPWIGGLFGFVVAALGLGMVFDHLRAWWKQRKATRAVAEAASP